MFLSVGINMVYPTAPAVNKIGVPVYFPFSANELAPAKPAENCFIKDQLNFPGRQLN
jgi:hypothetical protein